MYKFFIETKQITNNTIEIIGEDVNHIKNVLRLKKGEKIQICNKQEKKTYESEIQEIKKDSIICKIRQEITQTTESNIYIHLFQGLPKAEKMETIIQKTTEIGISEITPVTMERTIVKLDEKSKQNKTQRWQKIAEVAAKQSKRDIIPKINSPINFKNIYENLEKYGIVLVAYEDEYNTTIKQVLKQIKQEYNKCQTIQDKKIAIIIGPEGGISKQEIQYLVENGAKSVSLGKRILRTETAPIVMSSIIIYELEE